MAQTVNPSNFLNDLPELQRQWVQNLHKTVNGALDLGVATKRQALDGSVNAGVYNNFVKGNGSGILIRVDAHGTNNGAPYTWPGAGTPLQIIHGLGRKPIGYHVVDMDKDVRVFRTAAPTSTILTVQPTDNTASVTLYIF